jgi:hypothetical protein
LGIGRCGKYQEAKNENGKPAFDMLHMLEYLWETGEICLFSTSSPLRAHYLQNKAILLIWIPPDGYVLCS